MADAEKQLEDVSCNKSPDEPSVEQNTGDPNVVDFDGPDDPENPMNWSTPKKTAAIAVVSLMTLLSCVLLFSSLILANSSSMQSHWLNY
jgi:hypothetical protein